MDNIVPNVSRWPLASSMMSLVKICNSWNDNNICSESRFVKQVVVSPVGRVFIRKAGTNNLYTKRKPQSHIIPACGQIFLSIDDCQVVWKHDYHLFFTFPLNWQVRSVYHFIIRLILNQSWCKWTCLWKILYFWLA